MNKSKVPVKYKNKKQTGGFRLFMSYMRHFLDVYIYNKNNKKDIVKDKKFFSRSLCENVEFFKREFGETADLSIKYLNIKDVQSALITMGGMVNKDTLTLSVMKPIVQEQDKIQGNTNQEKYDYIRDNIIVSPDQMQVSNFDDAFNMIMSGFALLAMDGCDSMLALGVQGFNFRSIAEPSTEIMQRGSREGFVEPLMINMTLIRRRLKTTDLRFELTQIGNTSKTSVCLCYLKSKVSQDILSKVKQKLAQINLESIMESGYIIPYLEDQGDFSLFSSVGMTERPDTVCGKISEGRIALIVDGTPNVLIVPYLFIEYFQHLDDYSMHTYFATFTRWLKYFAFILSTLLPGLYVGISTFNPEILPGPILTKIALAVGTTPFSLMFETILIHLIYEIMREAGLRIPRPLGHAVSIVGALVIGETAVSSGLIGAPTLMVVALTAISSYVIPNLYEPISILKFVFIVTGGLLGIWGIMIVFTLVLVNICAKNSYGVPFTSPLSPFNIFAMRDVLVRSGWSFLSKKNIQIQDLPGSEVKDRNIKNINKK